PILDAQAKVEYKRRLDDLRRDLEEAERFNDPTHAERAQGEIDALAAQLASAVGFGGRNRRSGSAAERARSAVTKRIKSSIKRIGEAIPLLRQPSSQPGQDRIFLLIQPAAGASGRVEVLIPLTFFCDTKSHTVTEKV